ncbi:VanZ family protein [Thermosulfuriphilus sp.]
MRERGSWALFFLVLGLIYLSIPLGPKVLRLTKSGLGEAFGLWLSLGLLMAGGLILYPLLRGQGEKVFIKSLFFLSLMALFGSQLRIVEERVHLLQYSLLAFCLHQALSFRLKKGVFWVALAISALCGLGDEIIQGFHPLRHFDIRDVAINALASGLGAGFRQGLVDPSGLLPRSHLRG